MSNPANIAMMHVLPVFSEENAQKAFENPLNCGFLAYFSKK